MYTTVGNGKAFNGQPRHRMQTQTFLLYTLGIVVDE